jgi:hypothetical protein
MTYAAPLQAQADMDGKITFVKGTTKDDDALLT